MEDYESDSPIIKESVLNWTEIPTQLSQVRYWQIEESQLERQDNLLIDLDAYTGVEETFFHLTDAGVNQKTFPAPDYLTKLQINFEINFDV